MQKTAHKIQNSAFRILKKHPKITPHAPLYTTHHTQYQLHNAIQSAKVRHFDTKILVHTIRYSMYKYIYIDKYIGIPLSIPFVHVYSTSPCTMPN